ncbi:MAG: ABC transporter substrate-binding protein [Chloroflexi bacterium]|nr:ABC transporter substrate-binding protein [Chloroflexota bacterium]
MNQDHRSAAQVMTRRRATASLATGMLAVAGGAFGPGCAVWGGQSPAAEGTPVAITYLHQWSQQQGHGPATDKLVARFNEQVPSVRVNPVFTADYYAKLTAILASGDMPDVITSNVDYLMTLVKQSASIIASPDTLAKGQYRLDKNEMQPVSRDMASFEGKFMAMPYALTSLGMGYNRSLFRQRGLDPAKPPANWNDIAMMGRQLNGGSDEAETWGIQWAGMDEQRWQCFLWQNGGELVDMTRRAATWNSPAGVDALQFWVDLVHRSRVASLQQPPNTFQLGRAGLVFTGSGVVSSIDKAVQDKFDWDVAVLPQGKQRASFAGGHALVTMKTGKHEAQAWRFAHWFTALPNVVEFNAVSTTLPPWRALEKQPVWQRFMADQPRMKPFVDMLPYSRSSPRLGTWSDAAKLLRTAIADAVAQKGTPKALLDDAARLAEPLIKNG